MSLYSDLEKMSQQIATLTEKVAALGDGKKEPTEQEIRDKAHQDRRDAYKKENGIPTRPHNYINKERKAEQEAQIRNSRNDRPQVNDGRTMQQKDQDNSTKVRPLLHPWKVTKSGNVLVNVTGGKIASQGHFNTAIPAQTLLTVADSNAFAVSATGEILLHIVRDSSTREMLSAEITWAASVTESTETDQYIPLASVTRTGSSITVDLQKRFDDISVFESLAIYNGEFRYFPLAMLGQNPYELPP